MCCLYDKVFSLRVASLPCGKTFPAAKCLDLLDPSQAVMAQGDLCPHWPKLYSNDEVKGCVKGYNFSVFFSCGVVVYFYSLAC